MIEEKCFNKRGMSVALSTNLLLLTYCLREHKRMKKDQKTLKKPSIVVLQKKEKVNGWICGFLCKAGTEAMPCASVHIPSVLRLCVCVSACQFT